MSTYEDIFGKRVKFFDDDPTLTSSYEGQVWYNSATGTLKSVVSFDSWVSSTPNTTGRRSYGSSGTQTANLIYAGVVPHPTVGAAATNVTEEYNGTGWASGGNFGASGYGIRGMGTQTAALSGGLFTPGGMNAATYKYDGTSWTSAGSLPAARAVMGTAGTQTAGLAFAGSSGPQFNNTSNTSYEYDGSSWTAGNSLTTARTYLAGIGTQTAAVGCGGYTGNPVNTTRTGATEEYDGTNWTSSGAMNTARTALMASGIQTAGLVFGGHTGSDSSATEKYDGSTWATSPATLGTANKNGGGSPAGTQSSALNTEGGGAPYGATVEEFNTSINTFTAASFSSGPNMNNGREGLLGGAGTNTAAIAFGGYKSSAYSNLSEGYNGSSWSNLPTMNSARASMASIGATQTAAIAAGGYGGTPEASYGAAAESYNGSSWTNISGVAPREQLEGCGTQTAGLICGGLDQPGGAGNETGKTEEWNGSAWSEQNDLNTARGQIVVGGSQTAAICAGGQVGYPITVQTGAEEYNGTSWTAVTAIPTARRGMGTALTAPQTATIIMGGNPSPGNNLAYDGTSWSTTANLARSNTTNLGSAGASQATAMVFGGSPYSNATELFTAETETVTAKTLTTG